MNDKPKEKVYAERLDSSKKNREKITKEAIQDHKKENPKTKENKIVITLFLSKIVIKDWLLLWQDRA